MMTTPIDLPTPSAAAVALHERALAARGAERAAVRELAHALVDLAEGAYRELGYASIREYAWTKLRIGSSTCRQLLQLGRNLPSQPHVDAALRDGRLDWTKARDIQSVVTPENEERLVELAVQCSSRQLEAVKAEIRAGREPVVPPEPKIADRTRRVMNLLGVDADVVDQYLAWVRAESGSADIELGEAVAALIRKELASIADAPRGADGAPDVDAPTSEPYRVFLTTCPCCKETTSPTADVDQTVADEAACDAEVVDEQGRNDAVVPRRVRRLVLARDGHRCSVPGCRLRLWLHVHHLKSRAFGGENVPANLLTLCSHHHRRVHDGVLAIEVVGDRLVVTKADGTVREGPWRGDPRGRMAA